MGSNGGQCTRISRSHEACRPMHSGVRGRRVRSATATCGVGGQGSQFLAAALHFSDRQLGAFQPMCVLGCLRQNARTAVTTAVNGRKRNRSSPYEMRLKWGRWDRNRTGALRLWSTRRAVQGRLRLSNLPVNWRFLALHRPGSSKHVQPVCSRFCSHCRSHEGRLPLAPSASPRSCALGRR
jgi:hypothetical protein